MPHPLKKAALSLGNMHFLMKQTYTAVEEENPIAKYISEINILRQLKHPNVIAFKCLSQSEENLAIVTEYLESNLGTVLFRDNENKQKAFSLNWEQKVLLLLDIARGVHYLHSKNIVHACLTPSTILLSNDMRAKLSDFFISANSMLNKNVNFAERIRLLRTPYYMSPELLNDETPDKSTDVYSFGVIMWEVFSRTPVYNRNKDFLTIALKIKKDKYRPISEDYFKSLIESREDKKYGNGEIDEFKRQYLNLMKACWSHDPQDRPTMDRIIRVLKMSSEKNTTVTGIPVNVTGAAVEHEMKSMKYEKLKLIGRGGQAHVFLVKDKTTQAKYAMKKFFSCKLTELNSVLNEIRTYTTLKHDCLVQVKDFFVSDIDQDSNCSFNLIMEYCDGGDLLNLIKAKKAQRTYIDEKVLFQITYQLFLGVQYIHSNKIVHRDLVCNYMLMRLIFVETTEHLLNEKLKCY
jgi:serine/threonine protein kinase